MSGSNTGNSCGSGLNKPIASRLIKDNGKDIFVGQQVVYSRVAPLGNGAYGEVWSFRRIEDQCDFAIKILSPLNLFEPSSTGIFNSKSAICLQRGIALTAEQIASNKIEPENIWWYYNKCDKNKYIAVYLDIRGKFRELNLLMCVNLYGLKPSHFEDFTDLESLLKINAQGEEIVINQIAYKLPIIPPHYLKFLASRQKLFLEIKNMSVLNGHTNIVTFVEVLEKIEATSSTIYIVQELVTGVNMHEKVKIMNERDELKFKKGIYTVEDFVAREMFAKRYFYQLLLGLKHCHRKEIAHRDLKLANLLLSDNDESAALKICDFGLSKTMLSMESDDLNESFEPHSSINSISNSSDFLGDSNQIIDLSDIDVPEFEQTQKFEVEYGEHEEEIDPEFYIKPKLHRLKSVEGIGTDHYRAPEINSENKLGYDGTKVDMWSSGIILFALLTGKHPFNPNPSECPLYDSFTKWCIENDALLSNSNGKNTAVSYFHLFHFKSSSYHQKLDIPFSPLLCDLLASLLHPDFSRRLSADEALYHGWFDGLESRQPRSRSNSHSSGARATPPKEKNANNNNFSSPGLHNSGVTRSVTFKSATSPPSVFRGAGQGPGLGHPPTSSNLLSDGCVSSSNSDISGINNCDAV